MGRAGVKFVQVDTGMWSSCCTSDDYLGTVAACNAWRLACRHMQGTLSGTYRPNHGVEFQQLLGLLPKDKSVLYNAKDRGWQLSI